MALGCGRNVIPVNILVRPPLGYPAPVLLGRIRLLTMNITILGIWLERELLALTVPVTGSLKTWQANWNYGRHYNEYETDTNAIIFFR